MFTNKVDREKRNLWDKFDEFLDSCDQINVKVLPRLRYKRSIRKIAKGWVQHVERHKRRMPEQTQFILVFYEDRISYMPSNYACLLPLRRGLGSHTSYIPEMKRAVETMLWMRYKKHPAYAINSVNKLGHEKKILKEITQELVSLGMDAKVRKQSISSSHSISPFSYEILLTV